MCNLKNKVPKTTLIVFLNGSTEPALVKQANYLPQRKYRKYISFSVGRKRIDKKGKEIKPNTITYNIKFIDSLRFVASSLSILLDDFAEGINLYLLYYIYLVLLYEFNY